MQMHRPRASASWGTVSEWAGISHPESAAAAPSPASPGPPRRRRQQAVSLALGSDLRPGQDLRPPTLSPRSLVPRRACRLRSRKFRRGVVRRQGL